MQKAKGTVLPVISNSTANFDMTANERISDFRRIGQESHVIDFR